MAVALGDADWLNSLQIDKDVSKLSSWIFFQTWLIDGYPGCDAHHWPIRKGGIAIFKVEGFDKTTASVNPGERIVDIYY